ncbi:hypothetical protein KFE98_15360 [bacterium SCSIO 12741]|nr:hypothetical protein KFE98_15360 [bacterium SCSIO 12741]
MSKTSANSSDIRTRFKLDLSFFPAWLITFISTYAISYVWHGILLNDLTRIAYPKDLFLLMVAVVYFVISFVITFLIKVMTSPDKGVLRGIWIGGSVGAFIYLIAFVFGISFYANPSLEHILLDACWQVVEQSFGAIVAASVLTLATSMSKVKTLD